MSENIVFSYQGAFGPPTYGHYKSMETFIQRIIQDYGEDYKYTFLFMPTKSSSSKPHLQGTMNQRERILQIFSNKLKEKYLDVTIAPSSIEFDKETSSDTINTIDVLTEKYPGYKIILGMGKDNALQLPYWGRIIEYKSKVESIYLVNREVGGETRVFENSDGKEIGTFDALVPSWAAKTERLEPVFGITKEQLEEGNKIPNDTKINIELPVIKEINADIPPSSSSMIRHFISRIIKGEDRGENKTKIKNLMFGTDEFEGDEGIDEIVNSVIEDYKTLYNENENEKVRESLNSSYGKNREYDYEYETYMNRISHGPSINKARGGKSKKSKSMKKRNTKKRKLHKKRKSYKKSKRSKRN